VVGFCEHDGIIRCRCPSLAEVLLVCEDGVRLGPSRAASGRSEKNFFVPLATTDPQGEK